MTHKQSEAASATGPLSAIASHPRSTGASRLDGHPHSSARCTCVPPAPQAHGPRPHEDMAQVHKSINQSIQRTRPHQSGSGIDRTHQQPGRLQPAIGGQALKALQQLAAVHGSVGAFQCSTPALPPPPWAVATTITITRRAAHACVQMLRTGQVAAPSSQCAHAAALVTPPQIQHELNPDPMRACEGARPPALAHAPFSCTLNRAPAPAFRQCN